MSTMRTIYHLMRADFLERTRRYSFLITLGFTLYAAYVFLPPNHSSYVTMQMAGHRGVYNSAWVGSLVAMMASLFLSLTGFYLVKNAVARDRQTGVGQIIAATPLGKILYLVGKTLSNFCVLAVMTAVVAVAAGGMQLLRGEVLHIDPWQLAAPFLLITLPALAFISALAVLFESIKPLRGGLGNVIFYFLWIFTITGEIFKTVDLIGMGVPIRSMQAECKVAFPEYEASDRQFSMGFNFKKGGELWHLKTFEWSGMQWTPEMIVGRIKWLAFAMGIAFIAALFFDRFDSEAGTAGAATEKRGFFRRRSRKGDEEADADHLLILDRPEPKTKAHAKSLSRLRPASYEYGGGAGKDNAKKKHLGSSLRSLRAFASLREIFLLFLQRFHFKDTTPAIAGVGHFRFSGLLIAELKLMLKGVSRWWFIVALGLIIVGLSIPLKNARQWVLPFAWIWPLLLWSKMGTRELRHSTNQMIFSAAHSLGRQLPAAWLAGVVLAMLIGGGVGLKLIFSGDWQSVFGWVTGALFIPTLALAFGVWSGSSKLFEVIYMILWYMGPINKLPALDFTGLNSPDLALSYFVITVVLFIAAVIGRRRQLQL